MNFSHKIILSKILRKCLLTFDLIQRISILILFAIASFCVSLFIVSTTVMAPDSIQSPLLDLNIPAFFSGNLSINHQSYLEVRAHEGLLLDTSIAHDAWNLGQLVGLKDLYSLLPLFLCWIIATLYYFHAKIRN